MMVGLASSQNNVGSAPTPTVKTDKSDYLPGETVNITGTGWVPGQPVALQIVESDNDASWTASATPSAMGNFSNSGFVVQPEDIGVLFTLTATQGTRSAWTQFTDVVGPGIAPNGDPGGFEIQGGVVATAGGGHTDWIANGAGTTGLLTSAGVPIAPRTFRRLDAAGSTSITADDVFAGSEKTAGNPNSYTWKTASAGNKDDLNNVYGHASTDSSGHTWITGSADRLSNNGTAFVDFELNQAALTQVTDSGCSSPPCGHFVTNPAGAVAGDPLFASGGRTVNDLLVTANYGSGGSLATIIVYQWEPCTVGSPCTIPAATTGFGWRDITSSIAVGGAFVATNIVDGVSVPYGAFGLTTYMKNQFVEMSLDVTQLIQTAIDPCVGIVVQTVFVKTKVSTSPNAGLDDFVTPINVSLNAGFVATATATDVKCHGGSDGTVTVNIDGGIAPYTVTLNPGGMMQTTGSTNPASVIFTGLSANTYTATVVATGGCTKTTAPVTVNQPSAVTASVTGQTNVSCFGGSDGSMTVTFSGGTPSYTCSLDGGAFSLCSSPATFNNLAAGSHTVTVKDSSGCTAPATTSITQPSASVTSSSTKSDPLCSTGLGSMTVTFSGGTSPYQCSLDGGAFAACTSPATFNSLSAGSHSVVVKDSKGCAAPATSQTIVIPTAVTSSSSKTDPDCSTGVGSMSVTFSGGTPGYTCSLDGGAFAACTSPATFSSLSAGSHSVVVRDSNSCAAPATSQTIVIPTAVTASGTETDPNCSAGTGEIDVTFSGGTPGYTCSLDGGAFAACTSPASFTGLSSGSHSVIVHDSKGCAAPTVTKTVTIPSAVTTSSTSTNPDCSTGLGSMSVAFSGGTPGYQCNIDGGAFAACTSPTTFNNLSAGSHTVQVKDSKACFGPDQTKTITIPSAISASETTSPASCNGGSDGSVTVTVSGGTSPYSVTVNGVTHSGVTSSTTFTGLASGTYPAAITDAKQCSGSATGVLVNQPAAIVASETTSPASCHGGTDGSVTVTVSGGTSPYSVTVNGVTHTGVTSSTTFTGLASGTYPASITDAHGCTGSATGVLVDQPAAIVASETTSPASCNGGTDGSVTVTVSGGTSPYSVTVNGVTHTGVTSSTTFTGLASGTYPASITDAHGCTGSATGVLVDQPAAISASETTTPAGCHGGTDGTVTVTVSGGTAPYSVTVNGVTHTGVTSSTTFTGLASGTYPATITDAHGCAGSATGVLVGQASAISASETATPVSCNGGTDGTVTVNVSGGTAPYSVTVNGVTHTGVTSSTTFTGLAAGNYPATITDAHGCTGSAAAATVNQPTPVTTSSSKVDPLCSGGTGSMTVNFSGGTPGYQCSLDGGAFAACTSPATFNNLGAGSHTVNVKDSHGCTGPAQSQTIVVPSPLSAQVSTTPVSSPGASDGSVKVVVSGGTAPYTVTLNGTIQTIPSDGGSTTFGGLAGGSYSITIVDANGCGIGVTAIVGAPTVQVTLCSILPSIAQGGNVGGFTVFTVTLPGGPLSAPLTVSYAMSGTAVQGLDYSLSAPVFTIPAGKTSASITIIALRNPSPQRTATMTIVNGPAYFAVPPTNTATVIIR
jgi:hypothetical protein